MDVSPEKKDELLKKIFANEKLEYERLLTFSLDDKDQDFASTYAMLCQFKRRKYLRLEGSNRLSRSFNIIAHVEGMDFLRRGGFTVQEKVLKNNIEKLLLEIEELKKTIPEDYLSKAGTITTIARNILSALTLIH